MQRTFGPAATHSAGEPLKVSCCTRQTYCIKLDGKSCRDHTPPREIPDTNDTPEWCKYRQMIERDVADDQEMRALGLLSKDRAELSAMLKALPAEVRGSSRKDNRPWKLTEMNAGMMRHALLKAHRAKSATPDRSA